MIPNDQFDLASWLISSVLLFIAILAIIPLIKIAIGLTLIMASSIFRGNRARLYKVGVKLLPAFLRATLGIGIAMSFAQPAHAVEQPVIIDRVVNIEIPVDEPVKADSIAESQTYKVQRGDSLWKIAEEYVVGENSTVTDIDKAWREIWELNRNVIGDNPSLIYVGQKLLLP
ncbi:MAG: LysM domain [Actinomycetota bacterium]|jgi:LysM repeat protein